MHFQISWSFIFQPVFWAFFKFTFLKKWRKVTRHLICLCLYTHGWILNNYGKQRRVPQSFRGATHSTAPPGKKITEDYRRCLWKEAVSRTCQGTEGNSIPSWKATGKKTCSENYLQCSIICIPQYLITPSSTYHEIWHEHVKPIKFPSSSYFKGL